MTDRPILFSGPMVRALLAGTKTQTRRLFPKAEGLESVERTEAGGWRFRYRLHFDPSVDGYVKPPRIAVGDRLYVRETWAPLDRLTHNDPGTRALSDRGFYKADEGTVDGEITRWTPAIHQPRWASRLTLTVTDVRVERLQDISEADALAEGMTQATADAIMEPDELTMYAATHILCPDARGRILYETIWDQINGDGAWASNPWVAAYTFTVEHGNIDQLKP